PRPAPPARLPAAPPGPARAPRPAARDPGGARAARAAPAPHAARRRPAARVRAALHAGPLPRHGWRRRRGRRAPRAAPGPRRPGHELREHGESDLFFLDLQTLRAGDEGWLVLDVTAASDRWLLNRNKDLGLRLYVETEDGLSVDPGLAGLLGQRAPRSKQPFMVTFFRASSRPVRAPRAVRPLKRRPLKKTNELPHPNKLPGIFDDVHGSDGRQACRRHELYVSFQDLGWLDWVIAPQGYSAYYCEGECSFPLDSCMNATNHAILQSLVHLMKPDAVPKACCAPTKLSATSVLYYDSSNNVILRKHRNMVVRACGCH
uniref:3-oxoacid CoA-transferase 2 n=1 Tax=Equus caballus TaxID=9796 RepID=F6QXG5_HORSE